MLLRNDFYGFCSPPCFLGTCLRFPFRMGRCVRYGFLRFLRLHDFFVPFDRDMKGSFFEFHVPVSRWSGEQGAEYAQSRSGILFALVYADATSSCVENKFSFFVAPYETCSVTYDVSLFFHASFGIVHECMFRRTRGIYFFDLPIFQSQSLFPSFLQTFTRFRFGAEWGGHSDIGYLSDHPVLFYQILFLFSFDIIFHKKSPFSVYI